MKAEKIITEYALGNGADDVGICSAEPFEDMREIFEKNSEILKCQKYCCYSQKLQHEVFKSVR